MTGIATVSFLTVSYPAGRFLLINLWVIVAGFRPEVFDTLCRFINYVGYTLPINAREWADTLCGLVPGNPFSTGWGDGFLA